MTNSLNPELIDDIKKEGISRRAKRDNLRLLQILSYKALKDTVTKLLLVGLGVSSLDLITNLITTPQQLGLIIGGLGIAWQTIEMFRGIDEYKHIIKEFEKYKDDINNAIIRHKHIKASGGKVDSYLDSTNTGNVLRELSENYSPES
jgi:hypothetical protein